MEISIKMKIQKILNATDYIRFIELLHLFDENNQLWMLSFLNNFLEQPNLNESWCIFKHEQDKYIIISEEIFDIVDGFICIANRLNNREWNVYGLKGINQQ